MVNSNVSMTSTATPAVAVAGLNMATTELGHSANIPEAMSAAADLSTLVPQESGNSATGHPPGSGATGGQHWRVVLAMGNNVVLVAVCVFLIIHIIVCIYQIVYRWVAGKIPLYAKCRSGRRLRDKYDYIITLVTGTRSDSGTYGNVRMKVQGQSANSGNIVIATSLNETVLGLPLLKRGHADAFIISSREYLGDIRYMEVELRTDSVAESWFLSYVTVLDLSNQGHWYLPCNRWFRATIGAPNIQVLLAQPGDCLSLWCANFYRCLRELHLWLSPWCSSLLATRLQMLYSLTLCYCTVSALMFVYMLVYYAPIGAPHHGSEKYFTAREWVYLIASSFFIVFMMTVLQLLMRIVSLKTGSFLSNYTVICIDSSGSYHHNRGPQSTHKYAESDRNFGGNNTTNNEGSDDNANWNACGAEGMLEKWEKIWHEVRPEPTGYSNSDDDVSSWVSAISADALESWLRPLVEVLCSADVRLLEDNLNLEPLEQDLWNGLRELFGGLTVNSSFLVGRESGRGPWWNDSSERMADTKVSNTTGSLQLTGKPTAELLSHSISVRATNSTLFLLEMKLQDALDAVGTRRNRNLRLIHDAGGDAPRKNGDEKGIRRHRRFFWDYTHATPFDPEAILSKQCAELLTRDRLQIIAKKTLSEVITSDFLESIDTTIDAYIDREIREFVTAVVRSTYAAIRTQISDHETLIRYALETMEQVCSEVRSDIIPNIVRTVAQTLSEELTALQDLVSNLRMAAIAGKHMYVVLNNLALNIHVQFCRMLTGRRNAQVRFCDVFVATETGRVVEQLLVSEETENMDAELLARIRKVLLEVELIKNEDLIVNGSRCFQDGQPWSSERDITRRVVRLMYRKIIATTSGDEEANETIELPEVGDESSRFIWILVVKDARTLFNTFIRTIRRNVHACRVDSLATLGRALWGQGLQAPQLSILEAVRAEMEDGVLGLAIENVAGRILEVTGKASGEEALAELTAVWSSAEEPVNDVKSLWSMEDIITDSDEAFDTNNNNQSTDNRKITVSNVLDDFQTLCNKLVQLCTLTNRLNNLLAYNVSDTTPLVNQDDTEYEYATEEDTSSNQNVEEEDINENLSANRDAARDDDESTNQNAVTEATVQVDPQKSNDGVLVNAWVDDTSNAMIQSMGYVLFALLVALCAFSLAGTLALGVTLNPAQAWSWVRVFCLGLACHFFLLEIFKVFLLASFFAICQRKLIM